MKALFITCDPYNESIFKYTSRKQVHVSQLRPWRLIPRPGPDKCGHPAAHGAWILNTTPPSSGRESPPLRRRTRGQDHEDFQGGLYQEQEAAAGEARCGERAARGRGARALRMPSLPGSSKGNRPGLRAMGAPAVVPEVRQLRPNANCRCPKVAVGPIALRRGANSTSPEVFKN